MSVPVLRDDVVALLRALHREPPGGPALMLVRVPGDSWDLLPASIVNDPTLVVNGRLHAELPTDLGLVRLTLDSSSAELAYAVAAAAMAFDLAETHPSDAAALEAYRTVCAERGEAPAALSRFALHVRLYVAFANRPDRRAEHQAMWAVHDELAAHAERLRATGPFAGPMVAPVDAYAETLGVFLTDPGPGRLEGERSWSFGDVDSTLDFLYGRPELVARARLVIDPDSRAPLLDPASNGGRVVRVQAGIAADAPGMGAR